MKKSILSIFSLFLAAILISTFGCKKDSNKTVEPPKIEPKYNCQCINTNYAHNPLTGKSIITRQDTMISKTESIAECEAKSSSTHLAYEDLYKDCSVIY